jgi:hypothetical protein
VEGADERERGRTDRGRREGKKSGEGEREGGEEGKRVGLGTFRRGEERVEREKGTYKQQDDVGMYSVTHTS